jgi:hypothetical protein
VFLILVLSRSFAASFFISTCELAVTMLVACAMTASLLSLLFLFLIFLLML